MKDSTTKKQLIGSLTKGLIILEIMMEHDVVGVTEISKALKINKSSAYRLLITLEDRGFVKQDQISGKYSLGMKLAGFRTKVLEGMDIRDLARPFLNKLTEITKESSALSILQKDRATIIEKNSSKEFISANLYAGLSEPLHCTALGKVLMTFNTEENQNRLLENLTMERFTPKTITDKSELISQMSMIRLMGYAMDDEEYSLGMRCIAAPIFGSKGKLVAAIGISGPTIRIKPEEFDRYSKELVSIAQQLSSQLGYAKSDV